MKFKKMLNDEKVRNSPKKTKNSRHSIRSPQISNGNKHIQKPERPQITTYRNPNLVPQKHFKKNVPPYPNKNPGFRTLNQKVRNPVAQKGRPNGPRTKLPHPKNQKTPYSQSNIEKAKKITYTRQQNLKRNPTSKRQKFSDVFPGGPHTSNGFKPNFRPHPKDHNPNLDKSIKPQGGQDIPLFPHNKRPNEANLKQTSLQTPKSIKTSRGPVILGPKRPKQQILKIPLHQRPNLPQSSNPNLKNDFLRRPVRPHPSIKLSKTKNKRLPHLVRDGHKQKRIPRPRPTGYIRGGGRPNNVSPNADIIEEILPSHATDDKNKIQFGFTPKIQNPFLRPGIVEDTNLTSHDYNPQERVEIIKGLIEPNSHKTIRPSPSSNDQLIATGYGVVVDGNNVRDMTITDSYGGVQIIQTKNQDRPYNLGNTALPLRPPPKVSKLDYQGWNTEQKDSVSVIRPTSSFSFQSSNKKEAPKTVTYANEWSVYRPDQSSVIDFVPQKRPKLNTNFDREWTVRDTILRPSRTSKFTPPNTRGYNNEWSEVQPFNPNLYESIKSKNKLLQKNILSRHPFPNGGLQGEQPPHNLITEHQYIQATATNSANIIVASTLSPSTIARDSNDESGFRGSNGNILSISQETPKIPETPKKQEALVSSTHEFQFVPNTTTPTQDTPHPVVEPATIKNEPGYLTTKRSIAKPSLWDKNPFITSSETLLPSIEQVVDTPSNFHYSSIAQNRQTTRPLSSFASDSNTFINIFPSSTVKKDKSTRLSSYIEPDTGAFVNIYPASTSSKIAESYNKATNNVEPGSGNFINTYPSVSTKTIPSRNPGEDKSDIENFKHLYPLPTTKREESSSLTPYTEPDVGTFINIYPSTYSSKKPSITQPDPDFDSRTSINTLSSSTSLNHPNPSLPHVEPNYYPGAYNGIVTSSPLKKVISTDLPPGIEPDTGTFINIFPASTSKTAYITEYHGYVDSDTIRRNENIKEAHEFGVKISPYDDQRQFENDYQQNFNIFYDNSGDPSYVYEDDNSESNGVIPGISNYDTEYPTGWDGQDNYYANYEDSNDGNILDVSRIEGAHGENTPVGSIKVEDTESPKYGNKDNSYGSNKYPVQKEDNVSLYPSTISTSDNEDYIELINEQEDKNSVDIAYIGSDSFRGSEPNQYQNGEVPPFGSEGNTHINELENEHHKSLDNKLNEVNEHIEALGNTSNEHNETHNNKLDAINSQNALLSEDSLSNTVNIVDESNKDPLENTENKVTIVESENDPRLSTIFAPKPQLLYPSVTVKDSNKPLVIIGPQVPNENLFPAPPHIIPSAIDKQRKPVVVYGPQENPNKHIQIHPSNNNPNPNFIGPLRFNPNFIGPFNIPENYENIPAAPGGFEFVGPVVHGPVRFNPKEPENIIEKTQFNSKPEIIIGIPSSTLSSTTTTTAAVEEISSSPSSATTLKSENKVSSPIIEFKEIDEGRKIGSKYKINIRPSSRPILDVFKRRRSSTTTQSSSSLDTTTNDTPRGISFGGKYSPKYTIIRRSTTPSIVTARVPSKKIAGFFIPRSNRTKSRIEKVLPNKDTKITFEGDSNSILQTDAPGVIRDQKLNNIDGAIVESIPGHSLSAEETDPETRCQNACGENELCKIKPGEGVVCKCRPGFGRVEGSSTKCEKSKSFAIEVITTSESEEIKIVKLSPKEVEKAVADSYRKNIKELYFGSQITSIKVGNNTKRNIFFGGEKNLTHDDEMSFSMIVHIADDGKNSTEERLKSVLETPIKDTKLPLGADVTVSRVTIEDFDECTHKDHNDCSDQAVCHNIKGSYTCICKEGYHDLSGPEILSGRVCLATTTACDLCNGNGNCIAGETVTCECQSWFAGKNCQINMKLLLIVGCVSVGLMLVIACGVSCFCCKDGRGAAIRSKQNIPSPYGTGIGPMPPMRGHGVLMDPHGTMKSRAFVPRPYAIRPKRSKKSSAEGSSYNGSTSGGGSWQATYNGISGADSTTSKQSRKSGGLSSGIEALNPAVLIPRAKVKSKPFEDFLSEDEASSSPEANRALSEHTSLASRHRRRSIPFIIRSSRSERGGSIDPLLDGSFSDDSNSANRTLRGNTLRSVASETFEVPVMRTNTQITSGSISVRSLRSHATSDGGRTMAERDGGSSFVISASRSHQLYRLHDSDGSLDSL
ncbi:uncharacterized protein [Lepeophtheirus salmonis]|uniref:uncharacterized protein isoform X2 n=1 Tax=Lepeophtheirus salmonis TaxID=72036 RepID=UPI003AF36E35